MVQLTKDVIQDTSVNLSKDNRNLLLRHATGTGKSLSFIKIQDSFNYDNVYIIIAEKNHKQNWIDEYKKHNKEYLLDKVNFLCYASFHKLKDLNIDLICFDEAHHCMSDKRLEILKTISYKNIVLLSATIKNAHISKLEDIVGKIHEYIITLKKVIEDEIVPKPTFYLIPLELNNVETETIIFKRGISSKQSKIYCEFKDRFKYMADKKKYPNLHLIIRCTQTQKEQQLSNKYNYYKNIYFETNSINDKNKWLQCGSERKKYLADIKTSYVQKIISKIQNKRYVCFSNSIKQSTILSNNKNLIHSKIKNIDETINSFNEGLINNLHVVDMLKEGRNLVNVEVGIIVQLDGDSGSFIQRSGRIMRAKDPKIFIMYYKNTKDEVYLDNILKEISLEHINIINDIDNFNIN